METMQDAALIEKAQALFGGFDITVSDSRDNDDDKADVMDQYNKVVGELLRRGYSPSITIQFVK